VQRAPLGFHSRSPFCARDFVLLDFLVCEGAAPGFVSFGLEFKLGLVFLLLPAVHSVLISSVVIRSCL
jgi:hypothetical protein